MSDMKTRRNDADVQEFLASVSNHHRREDARTVLEIMARVTGEPPKMWGDSIIGFGQYTYQRADKSKHQWMITGLSPRKQALTVYIMPGFSRYQSLLESLGRHRHSVGCLYITRLTHIDLTVLEEIIRRSVDDMRAQYGC